VATVKPAVSCDYLVHYGELKQDDHGGMSRATSTSDVSSGCAEVMQKDEHIQTEDIMKVRTISKEAKELEFQPQEFSGSPAWHGGSSRRDQALS
jgi:hypothetical protein